ncbi:MAG: class I SAM-dependent methyltransferase [Planctomycetota bacterium]
MAIPDWQLPPGVPRGAWDYAQSKLVADDYDDYHAENTLFDFEEQVLREEFGEPPPDGVIADLGCGSGRALVPLCRAGWRGLAVDLSDAMLDVVRQKAELEGLAIDCVQANLVELTRDRVPDASADHATCLFSTLGMIRGRDNRFTALRHMARVLKSGGRLVLHVHNFWFNLYDPGGPGWVVRSLARGVLSRDGYEMGDKTYSYRGVPNFFLHVFRPAELRRDLRAAHLRVRRWIPLDVSRRHALPRPRLLPSLRANGWIIVAEKT